MSQRCSPLFFSRDLKNHEVKSLREFALAIGLYPFFFILFKLLYIPSTYPLPAGTFEDGFGSFSQGRIGLFRGG